MENEGNCSVGGKWSEQYIKITSLIFFHDHESLRVILLHIFQEGSIAYEMGTDVRIWL